MDWLTFFSTVIKSLAWPVAVTVIVVVLRRRIAELLQSLGARLSSAEGAGIKFTFSERVDKLEEVVVPEVSWKITERLSEPDPQHEALMSSGQPPAYIVSQAWVRLEQAFRETIKQPPSRRSTRSPNILDWLHWASQQELLTDDERSAIEDLRQMRNLATHSVDPAITMIDALRYWDIADTLIQKLKERRAAKDRDEARRRSD